MAQTHAPSGHEKIETSNFLMIVLILLVAAVGGLVEIVPLFFQRSTTQPVEGLKPYTALQLSGRDIYIREGCYNCHSQMIRPLRGDTLRYGPFSKAGEFVYDHPFQWGSKRTGPDLAREGKGPNKKSNSWHYKHLMDPRSMSPGSNMPTYAWMSEAKFDQKALPSKIAVLTQLGVPYPVMEATEIKQKALEQAAGIAKDLAAEGIVAIPDRQIIAVIAYLQKLGHYETPEIENKLGGKPLGVPFPKPGDPDKYRSASVNP